MIVCSVFIFFIGWTNAQDLLEYFISESSAVEGDPVTITCGVRHFVFCVAAKLLCVEAISLSKLDEQSGQFVEYVKYYNINNKNAEKVININNDWNIEMNRMPGGFDCSDCTKVGVIDANITVDITKVKLEDAGKYECSMQNNAEDYNGSVSEYVQNVCSDLAVKHNPCKTLETYGLKSDEDEEPRGSQARHVGLKHTVFGMISIFY
ncbi:hypothetical protein Bpfe_019453 [Biomphalaria pfeifferi]|uniref:Ig-like domain-containing protein n=1 Tax=Biomphalaria pfeifferi TaxID=112525 RepID=A0AAD8BBV5_BIOPF|nr:hypothetical protein Bpfe_019453 [Biomphalaria pfeifferi]